MAGINKAIIVGRLGSDPESRPTQNGGMVVNFSIATSEKWTDKNTGQPQERTEWHSITCFNKVAELAAQYLKKGSQVYIEGKLRTDKYTDQNGIERSSTKIHADQLSFLGDSNGNGGNGNNTNYQRNAPQGQGFGGQPQNFGNQQQPFANQQQPFANQQQPFANQQQPQHFGNQQPQMPQGQGFGGQQQQPVQQPQQMPVQGQQPQMPQQMPQGQGFGGQQPMQHPQQMPNQGFNNQMGQGQLPKAAPIDDDIPF